jgi:hypothetical protein
MTAPEKVEALARKMADDIVGAWEAPVQRPAGVACREAARPYAALLVEARAALRALTIDANRLCDRALGGTYEEDCRRSVASARSLLTKLEAL